jgi:hypothetical protein
VAGWLCDEQMSVWLYDRLTGRLWGCLMSKWQSGSLDRVAVEVLLPD